ncbi:MAG: acetyl-CoA hydrolase/transferase family protein, partial [Zoogloeaceae bacterium]|nr:acetyl-CoA hydrolase/transferase family protein [Zoogloeaceae bacterium]
MPNRIFNAEFKKKVCTPEEAAAFIENDMNIGMSGFTGAGYPKAVPSAIARRAFEERSAGRDLRVGVWTGASTAPELDGSMAAANAIARRLPYQSDPDCRKRMNSGDMYYMDQHLSHTAQIATTGVLGKCDVALIEVSGITADGKLIPSSSVGNNPTWLAQADKVILEVNSWQSEHLEGMHDIAMVDKWPNRKPIPITRADDIIGTPYMEVDPKKVVAIVETDQCDRNSAFTPPDGNSQKIANFILEFLTHEVKMGRIPKGLLPLQSGVGNVPNAVMAGLQAGPFEGLYSYTEVIQDGMIDLIKSGKLLCASATAFSLSPKCVEELNANMKDFKGKIILRPQEISNNPEVIRRMGIIGMNGLLEADIYGNVNSTHLMGTSMMNGIGGSGDFTRNAYLSIFMTPSVAKGGKISAIVPMVSHVDHTEHDVQVVVTEQGLADLRGLAPRQRARLIIEKCAHPDYKDRLWDYFKRAEASNCGKHTPHLL